MTDIPISVNGFKPVDAKDVLNWLAKIITYSDDPIKVYFYNTVIEKQERITGCFYRDHKIVFSSAPDSLMKGEENGSKEDRS